MALVALFAGSALSLPACATAAPKPATYSNPILFADYSDPDVIRVGKSYYMVASSFHLSPGLPVLKSEDLVHWKLIANAVPKLTFAPEYDMPGPFDLDDTKSKPVTGTKFFGRDALGVFNLKTAMAKRNLTGAPGTKEVAKQLARWREQLS